MAFNTKEQEIIRWGLENGKTKEEVKKAITNYRLGITPTKVSITEEPTKGEGFLGGLERTGERIISGIERKGEAVREAIQGEGEYASRSTLGRAVGATKEAFSAISNTAYLALPDDARAFLDKLAGGVGKGFEYLTDKISDSPRLQKYVTEKDTAKLEEALKVAADLGVISGEILGVEAAAQGLNKLNTLEQTMRARFAGYDQKIVDDAMSHIKTAQQAAEAFPQGVEQKGIQSLIETAKTNISRQFDAEGLGFLAKKIEKIDTKALGTLDDLAGAVDDVLKNPTVAQQLEKTVLRPAAERAQKVVAPVKRVAADIIPSRQRIINEQVTKALDLTPGDLDKIARSTGNELGVFMAEKNVIGANKVTTVRNLENLYNDAYKSVRSEIGKVDTRYRPVAVPNYKQALQQVQKKVESVVGLEDVATEVKTLLNKKQVALSDVQRAKELLDDHFSLYKVTGDVAAGAEKQGLANVRQQLRQFIEDEVKNKTGADIKALNNDVATSKTALNAIEIRSPKGLTRSNLRLGDLGVFGVGSFYGGPLVGGAFVIAKKIVESPSIRLRVAKFLDKVDDAQKSRILKQMEKGKAPDEISAIIKEESGLTNKQGGFIDFEAIAKSIDNTDKNIMTAFIDTVYSGKKPTKEIAQQAQTLADLMGLESRMGTNLAIAKEFSTILDKNRNAMREIIR